MSKIQRQVGFHNDNMRKVNHVYSYKFNRFLSQSSGNLLINGGLKGKRRECLINYICDSRARSNKTIVIFSDDALLEQALIDLANNGMIGQLYVCSEAYPNYAFFKGMKNNLICEYFNRLALEKGSKDTSEINSYASSFLSILSGRFQVDLNSLMRFACNDDTSIKNVTENPYDAEMIVSSPRGSVSFRSLLNNTQQTLSPLTTSSVEHYISIHNLINKDCVFLINTPPFNHEFYSIYFAMELKSVLNDEFICIFDDSILLNNDVMNSVVNVMKQRQQVTVVVSCENIVSISDEDSMLKNFNRNCIFLNGNTPYTDLQQVLSSYGQYTHMQPMANRTSPPRLLFTLYRGEGEAAVLYTRDRVLLQEEYDNEVLLKGGSSSEIVIAKKLLM